MDANVYLLDAYRERRHDRDVRDALKSDAFDLASFLDRFFPTGDAGEQLDAKPPTPLGRA